jgi:Wzt C-terminal domain
MPLVPAIIRPNIDGDGRARLLDFRLINADGHDVQALDASDVYDLWVKVLFCVDIDTPVVGFFFKTIDGIKISGANSEHNVDLDGEALATCAAGDTICARFRLEMSMVHANYLVSLGVTEDVGAELLPLDRRYDSILIKINNTRPEFGLVDLGIRCAVFAE